MPAYDVSLVTYKAFDVINPEIYDIDDMVIYSYLPEEPGHYYRKIKWENNELSYVTSLDSYVVYTSGAWVDDRYKFITFGENQSLSIGDYIWLTSWASEYHELFMTDGSSIKSIADSIRNKISSSASLTYPEDFVVSINNIYTVEEYLADSYWTRIRNLIRRGEAPNYYPVGYEFSVTKGAQSIPFIVRDYNTIKAADDSIVNTMTLEMKHVYGTSSAYKGLVFDAPEAIYYAAGGLSGNRSYYFIVKNQDWYAADNDVAYYFSLNNDVPVGSQLVLNMTYNQSLEGKTISVYTSPSATVASETATLSSTVIAGSIYLGATDGNTLNMNFMHRVALGSNNYAQSNIRQWLNASGAVNTYYTAQTRFDRPASAYIGSDTAYAGFANSLDADFLAAVQPAAILCRTNSVYETASLNGDTFSKNQIYTLNDKFFLLSRPEIYGTWDSTSYKDGEILDWYVGKTNAQRIKYDSFGTARNAWLRSPTPTGGSNERVISADGSMSGRSVDSTIGSTVACIIA